MSEYIQTATNCFVSRQAVLEDAKRIELKGRCVVKEGCRLRGPLRLQRYVIVGDNVVLQSLDDDSVATVGTYTVLEAGVVSRAAHIGSYCRIGAGAELLEGCKVHDHCVLEPNVKLGKGAVVPPWTHISNKGVWTTLPPGTAVDVQDYVLQLYYDFVGTQQQ